MNGNIGYDARGPSNGIAVGANLNLKEPYENDSEEEEDEEDQRPQLYQQNEDYDKQYKVVLIGDGMVGKTSIIVKFIANAFDPIYKQTQIVERISKIIDIQDKIIKLTIWDTVSQERFYSMTKTFYNDAVGAFLVFDITSHESFEHVKTIWKTELNNLGKDVNVVLLVGNKVDLEVERKVTKEEANSFAENNSMGYIETSALNNFNIESAFRRMCTEIIALEEEQDKNDPKKKKKKKAKSRGSKLKKRNNEENAKKKKSCC